MASQYGRGKQPSNQSKKQTETRMFDNDSQDSYENKPQGEEFATVVRNYREALARNDQLLEEIELAKKNSIFAEAETKTASKKVTELEASLKKLQKQLKQMQDDAASRQEYVQKMTTQIAELQRQYIQTVDDNQFKLKQLKQDMTDALMQASVYKETVRVLKTVIVAQYKNVRVEQLDRLTDSVLEKHVKGKMKASTADSLQNQHIMNLARDVRRSLETFFVEVTHQKTQELDEQQSRQQKQRQKMTRELQAYDKLKLELMRVQDQLAESTTNQKKLEKKLLTANSQIEQYKHEFERITTQHNYALTRQFKDRNEALKRNELTSQNRELMSENQALKETVREMSKLNNDLRGRVQQARDETLKATIFTQRQRRPPPPPPPVRIPSTHHSRIRKNHRSTGRQLSEQSDLSESQSGNEYFLKRHLNKQTDLQHRYQQLKLQYQDTLQSFERLLKTRQRRINQLQQIVTELAAC